LKDRTQRGLTGAVTSIDRVISEDGANDYDNKNVSTVISSRMKLRNE
jgi:hypothetical protein